LSRSLVRAGSPWRSVEVLGVTGSTNADLGAALAAGTAVAGTVLVAEHQDSGRGRMERTWISPTRAGLTFSVALAPAAPASRWGWLPLLAGLAVVDGVREVTDLELSLKWPNDALAPDGCKVCGVLSERLEQSGTSYAVVGVGLNVTTTEAELPVGTASSLVLAGVEHPDRQSLLVAILRALAARVRSWEAGDDPVADYRAACTTLGRTVRVELPMAEPITGIAVDVDATGRLLVA
jgi:BirA family transcriptional regulator, biotin operon repressor / biotin---[acetyl-CoA-carboxylase] ligase